MTPHPLLFPAIASLLIGLFAGCMEPETTPTNQQHPTKPPPTNLPNPCAEGYYTGCDGNPDALFMLERFGLHQFTNATPTDNQYQSPSEPRIEDGTVSWGQGGFGKPLENYLLDLQSGKRYSANETEGYLNVYPVPSACCMLYGLTPLQDQVSQHNDSKILLWNPNNGIKKVVWQKGPLYPYGFDGNWALLLHIDYHHSRENGLHAINVHTLESRELLPQQPHPIGHYYSDRLQGQVVSNRSAFFSLVDTIANRHYSTLWEVNLETGEKTAIMWRNTTLITDFDASPRYVVVPGPGVEHQSVWVMDRNNRTWWDLEKSPGAMVAMPRAGGEWCVFLEHHPPTRKTELVGIHIPTGTKHSLISNSKDMSLIKWDTDGERVVVALELELENPWAKYLGVQLYWMDLPKVE